MADKIFDLPIKPDFIEGFQVLASSKTQWDKFKQLDGIFKPSTDSVLLKQYNGNYFGLSVSISIFQDHSIQMLVDNGLFESTSYNEHESLDNVILEIIFNYLAIGFWNLCNLYGLKIQNKTNLPFANYNEMRLFVYIGLQSLYPECVQKYLH